MHERVETGPLGPPASVISVILATHRLLIATAAWVLFEYVVTLEEEIVIFWRRKWSPTSALLLFIRWTLLLEAIFILLPQPSIQNCSSRVIMILVPVMVGSVQTSAFAALRVFAIWNRSYRLAIWVFVLGVVPCASHVYVLTRSSAPIAFAGKEVFLCNQSRLLSGASNHIYAIVSRMPAIVSEGVVLALTFTKTYRWVRDNRRSSSSRSLAERLLRDGSLYFAVLLLINVAEIAFIFHPSSISGLATTLDIAPPLLTARFIMDIHNVSGMDTMHDSPMGAGDDQSAQSLSAFDSSTLTVLGDIGESSTIPGGTWPRSAVP